MMAIMTWDGTVRPMTENSARMMRGGRTYKRSRRRITQCRGIGKLVACGKNEFFPWGITCHWGESLA